MKTITNVNVHSEHIDVLGHVNNSVYFSYLETARMDWLEQAGFSFLPNQTIATVVLRLDILYKKEVRLGDSLHVVTSPQQLGNKSFLIKQDIYNQRNELVTEATVTLVMFNTKTRKSVKVVEEIARCFVDIPKKQRS